MIPSRTVDMGLGVAIIWYRFWWIHLGKLRFGADNRGRTYMGGRGHGREGLSAYWRSLKLELS
jgi:hypothetical protein